ncbi:MAG: hypothetical protein CMM28_11590 [Rhodospirillaceae bacterium]|nr:hypothetical protein [Rhodospirillaceae bacterium]MBO44355.1 hypothetical protein [Rhodospirillaceae bacterium]
MDAFIDDSVHTIVSEEDLRKVYKPAIKPALIKQTEYVTEPGRALIEAAPMIMLATSSADGVDVSPKGDGPGFVQLLDKRTLLIPDRPGNNRLDGLTNVINNPNVGIIFIVPGSNSTYRVNGKASISTNPALLERFLVKGKPPRTVLVVKVKEAYSHCPKAFVRADLWNQDTSRHPEGVPDHGDFAAHRDGGDAAYARDYVKNYETRLPKELY